MIMMSRSAAMLVAVAMSIGSTGCYKATFIRDPQVSRGVEHDELVHFFVFGLVGDPTIDVHQFCPDGKVAQVRTGANFGTGLVSLLTLGIYTPRKVYVTCAGDGRAVTLELNGDSQGHLVSAIRHSDSGEQVAAVTAVNGSDSWQIAFERNDR